MIRPLFAITAASLLSVCVAFSSHEAWAHVAYINMQTAPFTTQTTNADGSITYDRLGRVLGNGGWANGTDANWGNSHDVPWHLFSIPTEGAYIDLSITGGITVIPSNPTLTLLGDLTPAFSLYSGTVPGSAHEGAPAYPVPADKEGLWNALGDTTMANNSGQVRTIQYLTHAGTVNGTATSVSLNDYFLSGGLYTVVLGGACFECYPHYERLDPSDPAYDPNYENLIIDIENDAFQQRGFRSVLTVHPVAPVPVPAAVWLFSSGLAGLVGVLRRRQSAV
ncbi:MAG: hypothetical protein HOP32_10305 [Nitrospira sp.]|nr:hypothetical protein [Nitrospira sp.]